MSKDSDEIKRPKKKPSRKDAASVKNAKSSKPTAHKKKQSGKKKKKSASRALTFMRIGRSLRSGGSMTVKYTGSLITQVDSLAEGKSIELPAARFLKYRITFPMFILASIVVLVLALTAVNSSSIIVDHQTISIVGLPQDLEGYTILQVSDMHGARFGDEQASLLRTINDLSYNAVVFTGDMVGRRGDAQPFYELLDGMALNRPTFFIHGDSDPAPLLSEARDIEAPLNQLVLSDWVLGAIDGGAQYLSAPIAIDVGRSRLWLTPDSQLSINIPETVILLEEQLEQEMEGSALAIQSDYDSLPFTNYRYNQMLKLQQASSDMAGTSDLQIAIAHIPPSEEYISVSQLNHDVDDKTYVKTPDLILAGHYCGGGVRIPGYGALYIPNTLYRNHGWFPAQQDVMGVKEMGVSTLYTTSGLSVTDKIYVFRFRLFNQPQVSLITLTSAITDDLLGG